MFVVAYTSTAAAVCYYDLRRMMSRYVYPWFLSPDRELARRAKLRGRHQRGYGRHSARYMPRPCKVKVLEPVSTPPLPDLPMPGDGTEAWLVEPSKPAAPEPPVQPPERPTTAELRLPYVSYDDIAVVDMTETPAVTDAIARVMQEQKLGLAAR